jgi:hypothetical protein
VARLLTRPAEESDLDLSGLHVRRVTDRWLAVCDGPMATMPDWVDKDDARVVHRVLDTDRYPLTEPGGSRYRGLLADVSDQLRATGCCVLTDLVRPESRERLRREGAAVAPAAYHDVEDVNVYNTAPDRSLPVDHPARLVLRRGNAFVARDRIPADAIVQRLYADPTFQRFLADCFGLPRLYELADPLAGLTLNIVVPGQGHPWHFDTNEFTVSMLTQRAEGGGVFEYVPRIRSAGAENLTAVREVLAGRAADRVRRLQLRPGDLQLFAGRYSLHRVTEVAGGAARHSAIFAYSERPGVLGTPARTRQLFGRVTPAHLADASVRVDGLLI